MPLLPFIERVAGRHNLSPEEARDALLVILEGRASQPQLAAFLMAMRMKGETAGELVGFARAMRAMAAPVSHGLMGVPILDTCGTGGDGAGTFNISTIAAFVVAGAGVRVAKHGNRSISSRSGSADLLESFGVRIDLSPDDSARAIREVGIGFFFAPHFHTATRHAATVRADLKMRTLFNLLGPLTNPAGATSQIAGAPSEKAAGLIAEALATLGLARGLVVHGSDGLDEITTTGPTVAFEIRDSHVERRTLEPEDFAIRPASPADLKGGDHARNFEIAQAILAGERGPKRDIVLVNSAAALVVAGQVDTFLEGMAIATVSIDTGAARGKVDELTRFSKACS